MPNRLSFIIYAPEYHYGGGGIIALHKLCDTLNRLGYEAKIWGKPPQSDNQKFSLLKWPRRFLTKTLAERNVHNTFNLNPSFLTPMATKKDIKNSIVIYPEIVSGNPLNASRVVRWILFKPGFFTGEVNYGDDELFFCYNEVFNDPQYNKTPGNILHVTHVFSDIYNQTNFGARSGGCYMVRKGDESKLDYHPKDYLKVDGHSHEELAEIFNQKEYFISYDLHTMYSQYAALCGCKSIVVPDSAKTQAEVYPQIENTYAIAYGREDIDTACTQVQLKLLKDYMDAQETETIDSVDRFAKFSQNHFAGK